MPRGRDRGKTKGKKSTSKTKVLSQDERYIVVLFADIVGCSEISNHTKLSEYNTFVSDFQELFKEICNHYKVQRYEERDYDFFQAQARGDEGCLKIFLSRSDESLASDIDTAIMIALDLKRKWLFNEHNTDRIEKDGLLPVDIGIGIHAGKVFINKEEDGKDKYQYRPEGYTINLAKRIENASRKGVFTHILLSEAARGQLYNLKDEDTYVFNNPFPIEPKGISRDIRAFEIKHHFLGTLWYEEPSEASILYDDIDDNMVKIVQRAYEANPTNLWLAEEYILLATMNDYKKLKKEGKENDNNSLKKAYRKVLDVAQRVANSDLRDAGTLAIWGFILGERLDYDEEQKKYNEALKINKQNGNVHWYKALSISYQLYEQQDDKTEIGDFYNKHKDKIEKCFKAFRDALELKPFNPWIYYDYACELSWWSQVKQEKRNDAIDKLIDAFKLNSDIKERVSGQEYLGPIKDDPKVKKYLTE